MEIPRFDFYTATRKETVNVPASVDLAATRNSSDSDAYVQRDLLVRNVIDYIIDEMGCTYTITPDLSTVDPTLDGVENFLRNTKEGYCVQFASIPDFLVRMQAAKFLPHTDLDRYPSIKARLQGN